MGKGAFPCSCPTCCFSRLLLLPLGAPKASPQLPHPHPLPAPSHHRGTPRPALCSSLGLRGTSWVPARQRRGEGGRRDRRGGEGRRMLRGWLFASSPARNSQGLAWRMSHPLGTGNSGTPFHGRSRGMLQRGGRGLDPAWIETKLPGENGV